jgi:hypothetical protein
MDLTALIEFTATGSIRSVKRWDGPNDMWDGIDEWGAKEYQDALDTLVIWRDGVTPPTGADVKGNIPAFNQAMAAANQEAARIRALNARVKNLDIGRLLKALVRAGDLPKGNIPPGQLDALQALAEIDGEQPL